MFVALPYLFKWPNCPCNSSNEGWEEGEDGKGEDKVSVEALTSGLVGYMCVASPVDRSHTLSTCGEDR